MDNSDIDMFQRGLINLEEWVLESEVKVNTVKTKL